MSKTSPRLNSLIAELKSVARDSDTDVWWKVAQRLEKPRRTYAEVNLSRIDRYARPDETIVVPGKVLGSGILRMGITIAAVDFSRTAKRKISDVDGEAIRLEQAIKQNPSGSNVRVIR